MADGVFQPADQWWDIALPGIVAAAMGFQLVSEVRAKRCILFGEVGR